MCDSCKRRSAVRVELHEPDQLGFSFRADTHQQFHGDDAGQHQNPADRPLRGHLARQLQRLELHEELHAGHQRSS